MMSCGWIWIYAGLFLVLLELVVPGFILCFFGFGAMTVGALRLVLGEAFTPAWCLAAFSALSILYIVVLRRALKSVFVGKKEDRAHGLPNEFVGRSGTVVEDIRPPCAGRVLLGDAEWTAVSEEPLSKGARVTVVSQQNLTLKVKEV